METELKGLQDLISETLHPTRLSVYRYDEQYLLGCEDQVFAETEKVKRRMQDILNIPKKYWPDEFIIQRQQSAIIAFADIVYHYLHPNSVETVKLANAYPTLVAIYQYVYNCLEDPLIFIEKKLPNYFEWDFKVTEFQRLHLVSGLGKNLSSLKVGLKAINADKEIIKIISEYFKLHLAPDAIISYRKYGYIKELQHRLLLIVSKKDENYKEQITTLLLQFNFNSTEYYDYYILQLVNGANNFSNDTRRLIEYYSWNFKLVNQTPLKPELVHESRLSSLKEQISAWIREELQYLERNHQLYPQGAIKATETVSETKVHTSLAVSQLSLILKMLVDAKIITNKNHTQLMKMVARNFKTDRVENISEDSLRNKSYSFESGTINKVKDVVINLLNLVKGY